MRAINKIILHCSASDASFYNFDLMERDHVDHRGWNSIGYHFGIDYQGEIKILRPMKKAGAHCKGHNFSSIGICVLGLKMFSQKQMEALAKLVQTFLDIFDLTQDDVYGHNHFNHSKACPVFNVDKWKEKYLTKE
jgi:N-acetylmuramoyl-L-alanine amidase